MKSAIVALLCLCAAGCAPVGLCCQNDLHTAAMLGQPRVVHEIFYDAPRYPDALPATLGEFDTCTEIAYNRAGNIVRLDQFRGPDSVRLAGEVNTYDPTGTRIESSILRNKAGRPAQKVVYNYDSDGRLISEVETAGVSRSHISYDRRGYPRTRVDSAIFNKRPTVTRYRYDWRGRLRSERDMGRRARVEGALKRFTRRYFYRSNGTLAVVRIGSTEIDRYDGRGLLTSLTSIITKRDGEKKRSRGRYRVTITARYDDFDLRGNWTRRTQLHEGALQSVALRRIDYFEEESEVSRISAISAP